MQKPTAQTARMIDSDVREPITQRLHVFHTDSCHWYRLRPIVTITCTSIADGSWIPVDLLPSANPSPEFLVVATCDRLTVVISTSHVWNLLRTEDVHLHTPALQTVTHFLFTLETIVYFFHLLGATSKPFSSLSTRLAHAARLGFFFTKTRYINSLLLLLLLFQYIL